MSNQESGSPDITGAPDRGLMAGQQPPEITDEDLDNMTVDEVMALARNAESRLNVFVSLSVSYPERHDEALNKAREDFQRYVEALKERNYDVTGALIDPTLTVPDKEGTAPTYADATGTFAENAFVANVGGIGINTSNADPQGAMEQLQEQGGVDAPLRGLGTSPLMDESTISPRARAKNMSDRADRMREQADRLEEREQKRQDKARENQEVVGKARRVPLRDRGETE